MTANIFLITVLTLTGFAAVALEGRRDELEVVQSVDLSRYAGRWYEIARLPKAMRDWSRRAIRSSASSAAPIVRMQW